MTEHTFLKGSKVVLHAVPAEGWVFDRWTVGESVPHPAPGATWTMNSIETGGVFKAHFVEGFQYTLELDPADNAVNVPKDKVLTMTFNGPVRAYYPRKAYGGVTAAAEKTDDIRIYSADGTLFESFNESRMELRSAGSGRHDLVPVKNPESIGYIEGNKVVLDPKDDFVPGTGYYVLVSGMMIENPEYQLAGETLSPYWAMFPGFYGKDAFEDHDWNFTIAPAETTGGGGTTVTPGGGTTTVTTEVERDRADRPSDLVNLATEETPLAAPVVPAPLTSAPAAETLTDIPAEIAPLGVPVLPKTGEIPATLFYGIGGLIAAAGAFIKRR